MTLYLPYIGGQYWWPGHHKLWSQQQPHFSPHGTAKTNNRAFFSGNLVSSGISDAVIASVHSEKIRLKKLIKMMMMMMMIIMNRCKKRLFSRVPEIDFHHETEARKVMVDFKFDALYR